VHSQNVFPTFGGFLPTRVTIGLPHLGHSGAEAELAEKTAEGGASSATAVHFARLIPVLADPCFDCSRLVAEISAPKPNATGKAN
jgi:hypothetical protein